MFAKIQKYLLINHPLLWNIKIVPMSITILIFNLFFFFFGFFSNSIDFAHYYFETLENIFIFYLISGLTSLLILIIWLIFYLKNNAFKSLYPQKATSLYTEWLLVFLLLIGNTLYPCSFYQGTLIKTKTYASKEEVKKTIHLLNTVEILLPNKNYSFYSKGTSHYSGTNTNDSIRLLNFENNYYTGTSSHMTVKEWLVNGEKDSLKTLMSQYFKLQEKHKLTTNLTIDSWMKIIYNPPNFIIPGYNYINTQKETNTNSNYVQYSTLKDGYKHIYEAYYNNDSEVFFLVTFYVALCLSVLLFSFRVTSGRSWLISSITIGLLMFIYGISTAIYEIASGENMKKHSVIFWTIILLILTIYLIFGKSKKVSGVMLNLFFWIFPFISLLYYSNFISFNNNSPHSVYKFFTDNPTLFFWINLIFVIIFLFFLMKFIKKWKAQPLE